MHHCSLVSQNDCKSSGTRKLTVVVIDTYQYVLQIITLTVYYHMLGRHNYQALISSSQLITRSLQQNIETFLILTKSIKLTGLLLCLIHLICGVSLWQRCNESITKHSQIILVPFSTTTYRPALTHVTNEHLRAHVLPTPMLHFVQHIAFTTGHS